MARGRPKKKRIVQHKPAVRQFSPRGRRGRPDYVRIAEDALEALRLVDYKGASQRDAAGSMGVSQQTLSRILKKARSLISDALIHGKIIKIEEGGATNGPDKSRETG